MRALARRISYHAAFTRTSALLVLFAAFLVAAPSAGATAIMPPGANTVPSSGTFLYLNSQPGDFIGLGQERLITSADSSFNASLQPGGGHFSASLFPFAGGFWFVDIGPRPGSRSGRLLHGRHPLPVQPAGRTGTLDLRRRPWL